MWMYVFVVEWIQNLRKDFWPILLDFVQNLHFREEYNHKTELQNISNISPIFDKLKCWISQKLVGHFFGA